MASSARYKMTSVININDAPPYWYNEPHAYVYIGRAGRGFEGTWGNPFPLRPAYAREEIIEKYTAWLYEEFNAPYRARMYEALAGKTLVCFCKPKLCHGDIIVNYIDNVHRDL